MCLKHWNGETVPQYCSWPSRQPVYLAAPIYSADTYSSCHLENDCVILSRFAFRVVRCRLIKSNLSNMLCVLPTGGCSGGNILKIKNLLGIIIMAMGETRWSPLFFCCDLMNSETHTHSPCCSLKAAQMPWFNLQGEASSEQKLFFKLPDLCGNSVTRCEQFREKKFFVFVFYLCAGFRGKSQAGNGRKQLDLIDGWCKTCATPYSGDLPSVFVFWSVHSFISYHFSSQLHLILQRLEGV